MKRLFFVLILILPVCMVQAITIDGLFKKYQKVPEAQYKVLKGKELKAQADSVSTEEEKEMLLSAKEMRMLFFNDDEKEKEKLTSDLNSLKHYSLALSFTHNNGNQSVNVISEGHISKEVIQRFIDSFINPTISVDVYGKESSKDTDLISKPIFLISYWSITGLVYIDGDIKAGDAAKVLNFTTDTDATITIERVMPSEESNPSEESETSEESDASEESDE